MFQYNRPSTDGADGIGIANAVGGLVWCDADSCILGVCTVCDAAIPTPTQAPPTPSALMITIGVSALLVAVFGIAVILRCRRHQQHHHANGAEIGMTEIDLPAVLLVGATKLNVPLLSDIDDPEHMNTAVEPTGTNWTSASAPVSIDPGPTRCMEQRTSSFVTMQSSPAAILVVDRDLRIVAWSQGKSQQTPMGKRHVFSNRAGLSVVGMSSAVPLLTDPTDEIFSDLPFVHAHIRAKCMVTILRVLDTSEEQKVQAVMMHIRGIHGPVLLEMVADVLVKGSEPFAVLTGREVNCDLAGLITSGSSTTGTNDDNIITHEPPDPSVSDLSGVSVENE